MLLWLERRNTYEKYKKTAGKLFAMILTVSVAVSCVVSTGIFTASAYTAPKEGKIFITKQCTTNTVRQKVWFLTALKILTRKLISAV